MKINQSVSQYISQATSNQVVILAQLRTIIHQAVPQVIENIKWKMPVFAQEKDFAYMRFSKNHVTLGFYHFEKITKHKDLLEGEGNTLKHIKIKDLTDINEPIIKGWIKEIVG